MSPQLQTIIALAIVAVTVAWFAWRSFAKRKNPGCGSEGCAAVSPEVKKLRAKLKR
ncbi:FeoB-associated Cys-rich membrane protein [Opitutus sp. GAS368]|jgi:hypothetical protein|uniref:FeoB-associated Cys-rich membrane protein n=1 Tax=Opitutus sp. GAS368 TaxID=1882749 RepID=UPI00087BF691|nr:FeoB-associated Cys-rich membrane protein [Opitutus sp. GAS368]SDR95322.1 Virus attachment protein p12 family protein [Opitutus sp. GAS368]